jgi:hypothetical protein
MTFCRGSFFPTPAQPEFVNLKLGSGTRPDDIRELTNPMQKAQAPPSSSRQMAGYFELATSGLKS